MLFLILSCNLVIPLWIYILVLHPCLTDVIATFHFLSISRAAISRYPNIILIMSAHTFFFSKKIACSSSVLAFMANTSNSIMKSVIFFFSCLKVSIFYSAFAVLILLLNIILISHTNLFQSWVFVSSSSSLSFF